MGGKNLTKPFRRVDLQKESELSYARDIKGPARLWGLIRPIGRRQGEHVVLKKNGNARHGINTNENSICTAFKLCIISKKSEILSIYSTSMTLGKLVY